MISSEKENGLWKANLLKKILYKIIKNETFNEKSKINTSIEKDPLSTKSPKNKYLILNNFSFL